MIRNTVASWAFRATLATSFLVGVPAQAMGDLVPFDRTWKEQGFLSFFSNEYNLGGNSLGILSDGTVSVVWRPLDDGFGDAKSANWSWQVSEGVIPTDLTKKGGDDRNLAIYFVFVDPETAKTLNRNSARKLLRNSQTRALVYVWGGAHSRGALLRSPYSEGIRTKILRTNQTGNFAENVNLDADYRAAFGASPAVLVGLAVTADSDDTKGRIRGQISNLRID